MRLKDTYNYFKESAKEDRECAYYLYKKGMYSRALFFCHLSIEKLLKAVIILETRQLPKFSHSLLDLFTKASLSIFLEDNAKIIKDLNGYNIWGRYPDLRQDPKVILNKIKTYDKIKSFENIYSFLWNKVQ